jgi:hypothetical protein
MERRLAMAMKVCQIHNGKVSYLLVADGHKIPLEGNSGHATYVASIYQKLGYEIRYTGNGTSNNTEEQGLH